MPGIFVRALIDILLTHLVALTLIVFAIVGAALAGRISVPGINPAPTVGEFVHQESSLPVAPQAGSEPQLASGAESPAPIPPMSQPSSLPPSQPAMIGGTLPNYAAEGSGFRPPATDTPPAHTPFQRDREQWVQQARQAFWNGDLEGAEAAYMEAIAEFPEDADLFGELGNLYQSMGEDALALEAYFEAGLRLRAAGKLEKLSQVIELLETYGYPDAASLGP